MSTLSSSRSTSPHHQDCPGVLKRKDGRILDPSEFAAIFAIPEPPGLLHLEHLQEKVQARPHASLATLHRSNTKEWNGLSPASIQRTCRSIRCLEAVMAKNGTYIN